MASGLRWTAEQFEAAQRRVSSNSPSTIAPAPASPNTPTAAERVLALGRLEQGEMNPTEEAYAAHLELLKRAGEVHWYGFEVIKLRLGKSTFYEPDFLVQLPSGALEVHEVKGHWRDDARVKIKSAAYLFPMYRFIALKKRRIKDGGSWEIEEF